MSAAYGRRFTVTLASGVSEPARPKGRKLRLVCGDHVMVEMLTGERGRLITERLARNSELTRTNNRGQAEVLAANVDHVVVVIAPLPKPDSFVTDRLLGAGSLIGCKSTLVCNKSDLGDCRELAEQYNALGYEVFAVSTAEGQGLDEIARRIAGQTAVLIGQSGVGKSSLTNALVPDANLKTATIGQSSGEGRHTTVAAHRLPLGNGTFLIDSPGVRDFAPYVGALSDVIVVFPELESLAVDCRFHNCLHFKEPGCAVIAATVDNEILNRRYQSYRRLLNIARQTAETH